MFFFFFFFFFFFQAEDGIRDLTVTEVQTCALPILADRRKFCNSSLSVCRNNSASAANALFLASRSFNLKSRAIRGLCGLAQSFQRMAHGSGVDRKSTRLNSSHSQISYAVFCLKKKK